MAYYNTNRLEGDALKDAVQKAANQEKAILIYFLNKRGAFTPSEIFEKMQQVGKNWPITSIRRAMTDLTNDGHLIKTAATQPGMYKDPEHKWILNNKKYPFQLPGTQQNLFNTEAA